MNAGDGDSHCRQCAVTFTVVFEAFLKNADLELLIFVFSAQDCPRNGEPLVAHGAEAVDLLAAGHDHRAQNLVVHGVALFDQFLDFFFSFPG